MTIEQLITELKHYDPSRVVNICVFSKGGHETIIEVKQTGAVGGNTVQLWNADHELPMLPDRSQD